MTGIKTETVFSSVERMETAISVQENKQPFYAENIENALEDFLMRCTHNVWIRDPEQCEPGSMCVNCRQISQALEGYRVGRDAHMYYVAYMYSVRFTDRERDQAEAFQDSVKYNVCSECVEKYELLPPHPSGATMVYTKRTLYTPKSNTPTKFLYYQSANPYGRRVLVKSARKI